MTTAMALEYDKGEFVLAVALGITLMTFAFGINMLFHFLQGKDEKRCCIDWKNCNEFMVAGLS